MSDQPWDQRAAATEMAMAEADPESLAAAARLRSRFSPEVAAFSLTQVSLRRQAAAKFDAELLWNCTLYTTVEPCCMCSGTQYWAGIGRLVYGMSETRLRATTGRHPENPTLDVPCREVFSRGQKPIRVWGPIPAIEDELAAVHARFWLGR